MLLLCSTLHASRPSAPSRLVLLFEKRPRFWAAGVLCLVLAVSVGCGSAPASSDASGTCHIALPQSCPSPAPSYAADVAPILTDRCVSCHGPTNPQSGIDLSAYVSVYANREPVLAQVYHCLMPLAGAPDLSDAQAKTLLSWLVCKAPNT